MTRIASEAIRMVGRLKATKALAAIGASAALLGGGQLAAKGGDAQAQHSAHFVVSSMTINLPNSTSSTYLSYHFEVTARRGASLKGVIADVIAMEAGRVPIGYGGDSNPVVSPGRLRFDIDAALLRPGCGAVRGIAQIVILSRNEVVLEAIPVIPTVIPNPEPGGCH